MSGGSARDTVVDAPYFFLSYAHTAGDDLGASPSPDVWLPKLFGDLCGRVRQHSDLPAGAAENIGFMSQERRAGTAGWTPRLAQALATCRVFVPLFSHPYFESEDCGKQWSAFVRRASSERAAARAIIPALWTPVNARHRPAAARSLGFDDADLGPDYAKSGFYGIIKSTVYLDAYHKALDGLARMIVQAAQESPLAPDAAAEYASLPIAFGDGSPAPASHPLRITIAAPRQDELPDGPDASCYGADARSWNPYPGATRGLAEYAADLARRLGYRPVVGDMDQHGDELVREGPPSGPEVLIVDAWAATIDRYARLLRRLNSREAPWVQVVVPGPPAEAENAAVRSRPGPVLAVALGHKLTEGHSTSLSGARNAPSLDDFSRILPVVIVAAVRQYLRHASAYPPKPNPEVERPRLIFPLPDPPTTELSGA